MWRNWRFFCVDILFRVHTSKSVEMVGCSHFLLRWVLIMPASDQEEPWLHCQLFESTSCHLGGPCRTDRWPKLQSLVLQMKPNIVWCLCYIFMCVPLFTKDFDWNGLFACALHIWIESAVYANVALKGVHRGVGFALLWYFAVRSSVLWKPL